jgi:hypothetical protein
MVRQTCGAPAQAQVLSALQVPQVGQGAGEMSKTYREKLHLAWEWLRAEAMKDNEHAIVLLERLDKLERERKEARAKRQ